MKLEKHFWKYQRNYENKKKNQSEISLFDSGIPSFKVWNTLSQFYVRLLRLKYEDIWDRR